MEVARVRHPHKVLVHDNELEYLQRNDLKYVLHDAGWIISDVADNQVNEISVLPGCFDLCDDLLLFSFFQDTIVFHEKGYGYGKREEIEMKVLATVIARERSNTLEFDQDLDGDLEDKLNESFFVGEVTRSPEECTLKEGMLVTSLRKCPVNTKWLTMPVDALIPVPEKVDNGEAAAVISAYVLGMGILFHGCKDKERRFSTTSLKGLDILVTGGGTAEADAVVGLALYGGANRVFVLQSKLSMATRHAQSVHVQMVSDKPAEWKPFIDRYMDVIIDLEYPKNFGRLYGILKSTGRIVCKKASQSGIFSPLRGIQQEIKLFQYPNACIYDIDEKIKDEHAEMVRDARHLLRLLQRRRIRPNVEQYIRIEDIEAARRYMRRRPGSGTVVCEPWRE